MSDTKVSNKLTSNQIILLTITVIILSSFVFVDCDFVGAKDQNVTEKFKIEQVDIDLKEQKCFGSYRRFFPPVYPQTYRPGIH